MLFLQQPTNKSFVGCCIFTFTAPTIRRYREYTPFGLDLQQTADSPYNTTGSYRYGFNGKESDEDGEFGAATHYDYGFRVYNPAIARFLSVDPLAPDYPELTPYQFAGNNPNRIFSRNRNINILPQFGVDLSYNSVTGESTLKGNSALREGPLPFVEGEAEFYLDGNDLIYEGSSTFGAVFGFQKKEFTNLTTGGRGYGYLMEISFRGANLGVTDQALRQTNESVLNTYRQMDVRRNNFIQERIRLATGKDE